MKRQSFISLIAVALIFGIASLSSCTKLGQNLRFALPMQTGSVNVTLPVSGTSGAVTIGPVSNAFNVDSFVRASTANQLGASNISSVKLSSCIITINNANADNNFANFQSCSASFYSNINSTPLTLTIANNPDAYSNTLSLPVDTSAELSSYIGDKFFYTVSGNLRRPTTVPLNCTVTYGFNIIVKG